MFYVILDTLLKVSLNTNKTGLVFNATFNNVSYSVEHGDQFYWCLIPIFNNARYNVEDGDQLYWCLTTLSTMCQV
jgi:hypothetical protein